MRLFRSIAGAQGGQVFANMGAAFGLNDELAAQVVRYFMPPITKSIARRMESTHGLVHFLDLIGARRYDRYLADTEIFVLRHVAVEGQALLRELFPNPAHLQKIIGNRLKVLPVQPDVIEKMLPYIVILALGAIELKTRQPLKEVVIRVLNGRADPVAVTNPYRSLADEIRRRQMVAQGREDERRSALTNVIGALFARADAPRAA
ncbi:MAG: hypothetical protein ACFCUR_04585 [Rhodomicrobiaceae bacterium]